MKKPQGLQIKGILRFAGKTPYKGVDTIKQEMREYIKTHKAEETGNYVTLIHNAKPGTGVLDVEIFVPVSGPIPSAKRFKYVAEPTIKGCIMSKYRGHYLPAQDEDEELKQEALAKIAQMQQMQRA
jgi:hypothetical protein